MAAAVPTAFGTAHDCLFEFGRLSSGETALIHAGHGQAAWASAAIPTWAVAGARVLATASSVARLERLREYGTGRG